MLSQRHDDVMSAPAPTSTEGEPIRFRAPTLDEAIELAEQSLGARARVVAANQLRRGGIGGFFASDLGVEITVVVDDETVEEALARIVQDAAAEERQQWRGREDAPAVAEVMTSADMMTSAEMVTSVRFEDALRAFEAETSAMETDLVNEFRPHLPTRVHRVPRPSQAVAERHSVLAPANVERIEAAFASMHATPHIVPEPEGIVFDCSGAPMQLIAELPATFRPVLPPVKRVADQTPAAALAAVEPAAVAPQPEAGNTAGASLGDTELVVAATEQLIDTLSSRGPAAQFSVRVIMRSAQGVELEAFASVDTRSDVRSDIRSDAA